MTAQHFKYLLIVLSCLCGFIAIGCLTQEQSFTIQTKATRALEQAIEKEKEIRLSNIQVISFFHEEVTPQVVSRTEKKKWADQNYFCDTDSCRILLDSLFQAELAQIGITSPTAIRYVRNNKEYSSCKDSLFFKKATVLAPIVYKREENTNDSITLYAYFQTSWGTILNQVWAKILLVCLITGLVIAFIHFLICLWEKKNKVITIEKEVEKVVFKTEIIEKEKVSLVRTFGRQGKLPNGLHFDKKNGILTQGNNHVKLSGQKLTLFILLHEARKPIVSYEDIYTQGLMHTLKEKELDQQIMKNISNAISRLRKDLKKFPDIQIKVHQGKGCQMIIEN